jgi:hypothetical protein
MGTQSPAIGSNHRVRKAAAVSAGAVLLCLAGAGPALASTSPLPGPDGGVVATSIPEPPQPVLDLVHTVSKATGVPDPFAGTPKAPGTHHRNSHGTGPTLGHPRHHRHHQQQAPATVPATPPITAPAIAPSAIPGLRGFPTTTTQLGTSVAPPNVAAPKSATAQLAAVARSTVDALARDGGVPASRLLALVLGTMIVGLLGASHIRVAQGGIAPTG